MLPIIKGSISSVVKSNRIGVETHEKSEEFRIWSRSVCHAVIRKTLEPLEKYMTKGIHLKCGDGVTRLCFPVLCQYIADMEEQWLLCCMKQQTCPKCHHGVDSDITGIPHITPRSDDLMRDARMAAQGSQTAEDICVALGFHADEPFTTEYPYNNGILSAVGPDLLHQVSKCFKDHLLNRWVFPLITSTWCGPGAGKFKIGVVKAEIDSRFALVPGYPNLRRFPNGVFTENHHWTVHEYKAMMKITVAVLAGVCPPEGIRLIREYLHIHRLSHYAAHTSTSLEWLRSAVLTFWKMLTAPTGPWVTKGLVTSDFLPWQRLHYFSHYAESVIEKGALPSYSTDRTEIHHKPFKVAWQLSNKNGKAETIVLKEVVRLTAFQDMVGIVEGFEESEGATPSPTVSESVNDSESDTRVTASQDSDGIEDNRRQEHEDEEEIVAPEDDSEAPEKLTGPGITWPKEWCRGLRGRVSAMGQKVNLPGLHLALNKHFLASGDTTFTVTAGNNTRNPVIRIYTGVTIRYQSWRGDQSAPPATGPESQSGLTPARENELESLLNQKLMIKERIRAGVEGRSRQDCVLIRTPNRVPRGRVDSMSGRRVAQVMAFFQCEVLGIWHKLAYVSWFETKGKDAVTGLYHLKRSTKQSVIQVDDIERGVHLIPKFGHQVGATVGKKRLVEQSQRTVTVTVTSPTPNGGAEGTHQVGDGNSDSNVNLDGSIAAVSASLSGDSESADGVATATLKVKPWIDVWPHYDEYWLNTWSDDAIYKMIY